MCCAALANIRRTAYPFVESGLEPADDAGWTQQQYADALRSIVDAPANPVPARRLKATLGGDGGARAGRQALQALVAANLLAYRPQSDWARDIDGAAFEGDDVLITAQTPVDLACMRKLVRELELEQKLEQEQPTPSDGMVSCKSYACMGGLGSNCTVAIILLGQCIVNLRMAVHAG